MDKLLNLTFTVTDPRVFYIEKDVGREENEIYMGKELTYNVAREFVNFTNSLKIKSLYPDITKKENDYRSLITQFDDYC